MADDERDSSDSSNDKTPTRTDSRRGKPQGNNLNTFANDGSFLEMFKKKMEAEKLKNEEASTTATASDAGSTATATENQTDEQNNVGGGEIGPKKLSEPRKSFLSCVGKRRGGKVLPTGMVKKARKDSEEGQKNDAWSQYMAEVKRYKERSCEDEGKTRPLVK